MILLNTKNIVTGFLDQNTTLFRPYKKFNIYSFA